METHRFDYSFLRGEIPAEAARLALEIERHRSTIQTYRERNPTAFRRLSVDAARESVRASNEIEGIRTSRKGLDSIMRSEYGDLDGDGKQMAGYRDALELIGRRCDELDMDEDTARTLHSVMLEQAGVPIRGRFKRSDNEIVGIDSQGNRWTLFVPTSSADTPSTFAQMVMAYQEARNDCRTIRLLLIPCVILDYLCIHPFEDGNGRTSRLLSLVMLYNEGYDVGKYVSFEGVIDEREGLYYESLDRSDQGWHENANDCWPFVIDFLGDLLECYRRLSSVFESSGDGGKSERVEAAVRRSDGPVSRQDLCERLGDVAPSTISAVLKRLTNEGKVEKTGTFRDARYRWVGKRRGSRRASPPVKV